MNNTTKESNKKEVEKTQRIQKKEVESKIISEKEPYEEPPSLLKKITGWGMTVLWVSASAIIMAFAQVSLHLQQVSAVPLPTVTALFFIPFACAIILPFLAKFDDIRYAIFGGAAAGLIALLLVAVALYTPSILGVIEFNELYAGLVIRNLFISGISLIPASVTGAAIGGAIASY